MKKRIPAKTSKIEPVELHWEDVADLITLVRTYCETVEVSDDKAFYESIKEASEKAESPVTSLDIVGKNPIVKVSFKKSGSWLSQQFDKAEMPQQELDKIDLVYFRVKEFLGERRTAASGFLGPLPTLILVGVWALVVWQVFADKGESAGNLAIFAGFIFIFIWLMVAQKYINGMGSISLKPKASASNFWKRNKDKIWLLLLGGAITEAINLLSHFHQK